MAFEIKLILILIREKNMKGELCQKADYLTSAAEIKIQKVEEESTC